MKNIGLYMFSFLLFCAWTSSANALEVSPREHDFGQIEKGLDSNEILERSVTITNNEASELEIFTSSASLPLLLTM